jgi:hypothetical protein
MLLQGTHLPPFETNEVLGSGHSHTNSLRLKTKVGLQLQIVGTMPPVVLAVPGLFLPFKVEQAKQSPFSKTIAEGGQWHLLDDAMYR